MLTLWSFGVEFFLIPFGGACGALAGFAATRFLQMRTARSASGALPLADSFDCLMEENVAHLPGAAVTALQSFGLTLATLLSVLTGDRLSQPLSSEDSFLIEQTVRRYLPDTLNAYRAIPAGRRSVPGPDGRNPDESLVSQILALQRALETLVDRLAEEGCRRLERQGQFILQRNDDRPR